MTNELRPQSLTKPLMMVSSAVQAALAAWVVRWAKMFLTTLRDAVPGRSASEVVSRMAEPSPRAAVTVVCAQISMVLSPYVPCGSRLDLKLPVDGVVVGAGVRPPGQASAFRPQYSCRGGFHLGAPVRCPDSAP